MALSDPRVKKAVGGFVGMLKSGRGPPLRDGRGVPGRSDDETSSSFLGGGLLAAQQRAASLAASFNI